MKKILKWTKRLLLAATIAVGILFLSLVIYFRSIKVEKPDFAQNFIPSHLRFQQINDSTRVIGNNYLVRVDSGLYEMYIEGKPFERGENMGALTSDLHEYQEEAFIRQINKMIPNPFYLKFLKYMVTFFEKTNR